MDMKKLEIFRAVGRNGSISKAAATLSLGQAVVSKHVRALEADLGVQLFYRDGRGTALSAAGQIFDQHAEEVLSSLATARQKLEALRHAPVGEIGLALPPSVGLVLTVPLVTRFRAEFPQVHLTVIEAFSGHVQEWLMTGRTDVAVLYDARKVPNLVADRLVTEDLCLLGPPDGARNPAGDTVTLEETAQLPLILPGAPHGLRVLTDRSFAAADLVPNVMMDVDAMPSTLRLVQSGAGYTILSRSTVHDRIDAGIIRAWRIISPTIERNLLLATTTQRPATDASRHLARIVREEVAKQVDAGLWARSRAA